MICVCAENLAKLRVVVDILEIIKRLARYGGYLAHRHLDIEPARLYRLCKHSIELEKLLGDLVTALLIDIVSAPGGLRFVYGPDIFDRIAELDKVLGYVKKIIDIFLIAFGL